MTLPGVRHRPGVRPRPCNRPPRQPAEQQTQGSTKRAQSIESSYSPFLYGTGQRRTSAHRPLPSLNQRPHRRPQRQVLAGWRLTLSYTQGPLPAVWRPVRHEKLDPSRMGSSGWSLRVNVGYAARLPPTADDRWFPLKSILADFAPGSPSRSVMDGPPWRNPGNIPGNAGSFSTTRQAGPRPRICTESGHCREYPRTGSAHARSLSERSSR
mgnify:CR=1 FL=1